MLRPSKQDLLEARDRTLPDLIRPGLAILFSGINPGLYSAAVGHHFARPGNRFWPALHAAGITPRRLSPSEDRLLLDYHCGLTDIVERATARADELDPIELRAGRERLESKVQQFGPRAVAILGLGAFRTAFGRPRAVLGLQPDRISGAELWALPNPSGLNASHQVPDLAERLRALYLSAMDTMR